MTIQSEINKVKYKANNQVASSSGTFSSVPTIN